MVQERLQEIERDYGLSRDVLTARVQAGASSQYLENQWMRDDLAQVAAHHGLSLDTSAEREQAVTMLNDAYEAARVVLVSERVFEPQPPLVPDHRITSPVREATVQTTDHDTDRTDPYSDDDGYGRER